MEKKIDFNQVIDRSGTGSMKWEPWVLNSRFGNKKEGLLPLWVADMDFLSPQVVCDALESRLGHQIYGYTVQDPGAHTALINWFKTRHNWEIDPGWILNTPGIVPATHYLIQQFTHPGDQVLIQTPVYYPFASAIKKNGRRVVENSLVIKAGHYEMDFEDLEIKTSDPRLKMAILCSPHNPVGRVWTRDELGRFGDICIKNNVLIMPGYRHTSFQSISKWFSDHSIAANAVSKTFNLAGLGYSSLIIPNLRLRDEMGIYFENLGFHSTGSSSLFGAIAARAAYEGGQPWLESLILYLHENYAYLKDQVETRLPGVKIFELEATYLPWIDFRALGLSHEKIVQIMEEKAGLALDHGDWFGQNGAGFERMNIACPRAILEKACNRLVSAFFPYL